jgi:23S rRNA (cytosine1962-C5)-methyltransferase
VNGKPTRLNRLKMPRNDAQNSSRSDKRNANQSTKPQHGLSEHQSQKSSQSKSSQVFVAPERRAPSGKRVEETIPLILKTGADSNYALLDSGDGRKLERYGPYIIERPEAQAFWQKELDNKTWNRADVVFTGDADKDSDGDGIGRWQFPNEPLGETWPLSWENENRDRLDFHGRFTAFRHVGVFPEQAAHWQFIEQQVKARAKSEPIKLLNLFGYTGIASLVAARAGAHVTHVDASKKAIGWAKENQQLANLNDKPIRWICDDAVKFCEREIRRENSYDAIILDPPKFGRGPKGEVWQLFESLPHMIDLCRDLISPNPSFVILTSYSIRSSFYAMHEIMQEVFGDCGGELQSGELIIQTENSSRALSTSLFSRWIA